MSHLTRISKTLSYILRHGAEKENIPIRSDGYALIDDLIKHPNLSDVNLDIIKDVVSNDNKQRYNLVNENSKWYIRANQGHSIQVNNLELEEITDIEDCIHGTYYKAWNTIKNTGLNKMSRNHIHFTTEISDKVISGMRNNCQVAIYVDVKKCVENGIKFYKSKNDVILSPGNDQGIIPAEYFKKVVDIKTKKTIAKN